MGIEDSTLLLDFVSVTLLCYYYKISHYIVHLNYKSVTSNCWFGRVQQQFYIRTVNILWKYLNTTVILLFCETRFCYIHVSRNGLFKASQ